MFPLGRLITRSGQTCYGHACPGCGTPIHTRPFPLEDGDCPARAEVCPDCREEEA